MTDIITLAYRATTLDELEMAEELLLQRMKGTPEGKWPDRFPEELGLLEQIQHMRMHQPIPGPPVEEDEEEPELRPEGETPSGDSTEANLRGFLE